jgi:hypothetical protein
MEKYSKVRIVSSEEIEQVELPEDKPTDSPLRRLRSQYSANLYVTGKSGKVYHFPMAGAEVNVDEEDYLGLLEKVMKNSSCCGGRFQELSLFELVV